MVVAVRIKCPEVRVFYCWRKRSAERSKQMNLEKQMEYEKQVELQIKETGAALRMLLGYGKELAEEGAANHDKLKVLKRFSQNLAFPTLWEHQPSV